ncbi:DUF935 domain-containing protein [Minwuia thermotolerans]|uniref:DUF935 domain-containing protein n=1 Tax=Minwuia thermotolerans TaxID=2056226 RepID=A0A2M9G4R8_9PROT|nr:DUF935 domain-containing protein [Minwuia thermotolerans]PJK29323.1 DUF935 domain-containing protein [Minwuia thermotolerans]PJK30492.1 DUF935 domain-containing protein [Minwuia thermotolerans]PJK30715.1 DUF935 domain-containing protein [Minwuia thermotolerans]
MPETRILDQYGRPIERGKLTEELAAPSLRSVRQVISDHPEAGLTPARLARLLLDAEQGEPTAYLELAEAMEEKYPHYAAVVGVRKRAVAGLELQVEAASDAADDVKAADLVREAVVRDGIEDELIDLLDGIAKGYAVAEIIWRQEARAWWPERLEWRDPRWFRPSIEDGTTLLLRDIAGDLPLAPFKFITHHARAKSGIPIRAGLARAAAWLYLFQNFGLKDWIVFAETFGHPIRIGRYDAGASAEDRKVLLNAVSAIGTDMAGIVPRSMEIELIEAKLAGNIDLFERLCAYLDQQASKLVLGQTATTDAIAGGHAVGRVHDDVREDIRDADARQLCATLARDLVKPLVDLNLGPRRAYPRMRLVAPDDIPLDKRIDGLKTFVPMGLKVQMSEIRDMLGFADPDEGAELLVAPAPQAVPPPGGTDDPAADPAETAARRDRLTTAAATGAEADMLDNLAIAALESEGYDPLSDLVADALGELAEADDFDDFERRLRRLVGGEPPDGAVERLGDILFQAKLAGRIGVGLDEDA